MKFLRLLASSFFLLLAAICAALWYAARNEAQLVKLILAQLATRTGLQVETSGTRLGLGARLVIVLEQPRVRIDQHEIARLGSARAVFSYWTLLHRHGLPLYALALDGGTITINRQAPKASESSKSTSRLDALVHQLDGLSAVSRSFDLMEVAVVGGDHRPLAEHVSAVGYRAHYRGGTWPWLVKFSAEVNQGPMAGARFWGDLQLGRARDNPVNLIQGQISFWELSVREIKLAGLSATAHLDGNLQLAVSADAQFTGNFAASTSDLAVKWGALTPPLRVGNASSRGDYHVSATRAELLNFQLHLDESPMLEARATILNPYTATRTITFSASGIGLDLAHAANWVHFFTGLPPSMLHVAEHIRSGRLMVSQVALNSPQSLAKLNLQRLARKLEINAELTGLSYMPAPDTRLPPVYQFNAQLNYADAVARITQGTGQIGGSSIGDMNCDVNLLKAPNEVSYRLKVTTRLDVGEVYRAASNFIEHIEPSLRAQLPWVNGHTSVQLEAKGTIKSLQLSIPANYLVTANLGDVQFKLRKVSSAIWLNGGNLQLKPGRISLNKVVAIPLGQTGNMVINGMILPVNRPAQFRDLSVEIHQLASDKWVPLLVSPAQISVFGPMGGKLVANSQVGAEVPTVVGKLTLGHGIVQPGFLRDPIIVTRSATLTLDGKGLILDLPASWLDGEPLNFRMAVADLNHPQVRIDADVARLDFEVMRFIRLPWSPTTPPHFFPVPVTGHIEAQSGNFDKLAMTNISTDFYHTSQMWQVENFQATAFNGEMALTISGRARDDWINMKGTIADMDAGPLFVLSGNSREAPILGKLSATGDLWANTSTDFFRTLAGTVSLTMTNGTLNRFTLLKRILSLVNLKNYLTAQFPNPLEAGLPFRTLAADFRGAHGNFYTDDLRMNGPVMDITARGNINFADNTMDMEIDLMALQTVNWLINNIPIIGRHLGGATKHLVGAYFQVRGPTENPAIRPKPLTSVAKFVLRTLTLPINIIAPNTIE
jgi:hypothetical protein